MKANRKRVPGFYWVRFEGYEIVAEYTTGAGCTDSSTRSGFAEWPHWHIPGTDGCFRDREICELLYGPIPTPKDLLEVATAIGAKNTLVKLRPEDGAGRSTFTEAGRSA